MREILFRGFDEKLKIWIYGTYYVNCFRSVTIEGEYVRNDHYISYYDSMLGINLHRSVDRSTVGQYIGMNDSQCVKIYEGDIINFYDVTDDANVTCVVSWISEKSCFSARQSTKNHRNGNTTFYWDQIENIKVIGNIHDNKDILNMG